MPIYYDINGTLVAEDEYLAKRQEIADMHANDKDVVVFSAGRMVRATNYTPKLALTKGAHAESEVRGFVPIGIGRPLTLWITSAYVGNLPPKSGMSRRKKGCLLSSSVKSWSYQDAMPRALNALKSEVERNSEIQFAATEPGTQLAFYSPAVVDRQLNVTFEMAFDNVDEDFYSSIGDVMLSAGALPVFASASPYLLTVGSLFKIGAKIANAIYDSKAEFQASEKLNIDLSGPKIEAGYRLLTRTEMDRASLTEYGVREGRLVKKSDPSVAYKGDIPYIIIALDGTMDNSLNKFSTQAASASLLQQFYNIRGDGETSADAFVQAFQLYNDFRYSREAAEIKKYLSQPDLTEEDKARLEARYKAIVKNIRSEEFKPKDE